MSIPRDLVFAPAAKIGALYRARKVSPLEVMRAVLDRIDRVNPKVNAVVTLARESAPGEARRATAALRRGAELPPLLGIPVGIKDVDPVRVHERRPAGRAPDRGQAARRGRRAARGRRVRGRAAVGRSDSARRGVQPVIAAAVINAERVLRI